MITEIVSWRLPESMCREDTVSKYRLSVPTWQANPELIHKAFLFDEDDEPMLHPTSAGCISEWLRCN